MEVQDKELRVKNGSEQTIEDIAAKRIIFESFIELPSPESVDRVLSLVGDDYDDLVDLHEALIDHFKFILEYSAITGLMLNTLFFRYEAMDSVTLKPLSEYINSLIDAQSTITDMCFLINARSRGLRRAEHSVGLRQYLTDIVDRKDGSKS